MTPSRFANISDLLTPQQFEMIKQFVLEKGDRRTYRNLDNNNPHYEFEGFSVFLGANIGQRNINNDENISDFNELTIADWNAEITYYQLLIVRDGDVIGEKAWIKEGMKSGNIYLVDTYEKGIDNMRQQLANYLNIIRATIIN